MFGVSFHASRSLSAEYGAAGEDVVQDDVQHENATFFLHCSQPCGILSAHSRDCFGRAMGDDRLTCSTNCTG